ncbi:MAG: DUF4199 domain-containing protein [Bacteroidales bacterium]
MAEEILNKKKDSVFKFAFRWGSIIGFVTLIYYIVGFYTGWDKMLYFKDVYFFIEILLIAWTMNTYKRERGLIQIKFSSLILIGFYVSLVVALFYIIYFFLRISRLDPLFMNNYIVEVIELIKKEFNIDYSQLITPQIAKLFKAAFIFSMYISSIISTMIYTLLLASFMTLNQRINKR